MTSTAHHAPNYNYNDIRQWRLEKVVWRKIAEVYGVTHPSPLRWYENEQKRRATPTKQASRKTTKILTKSGSYYRPSCSRDVSLDVLSDYGAIAPTLYISKLSNDAWINKYAQGEWKARYLTELRDLIWKSKKGMYEVFRSGGKTFSCVGLFARWILEKRTEILCFTNAGMKDEIFRAVLDILQSEEIRADYGDVVDRSIENRGTLLCVRELRDNMRYPNFKVIGNWAASIGSHPGWIHIEDIVQDIAVSFEAEKRLRRWFARVVKFMKRRHTKITITGTRKDVDDFYQFVEEEHHFNVVKWEALTLTSGRYPTIEECEFDHEQEIVTKYPNVGKYKTQGCPEWQLDALLYMYLWHYEAFEAEMQNNPLPSQGKHFRPDDWIEVEEYKEYFNKYLIVDPAFGKSSGASKTAILTLGIRKGKIVIVDAFVGRLDRTEFADMIIDFHERHNPLQTVIEDNFRQITTRYDKDSKLLNLKGIRLIDQFGDKKERIASLKFTFMRKIFEIYISCPYKADIKAEYLSFSEQDTDKAIRQRYNALDTLSAGYEVLYPLVRGRTQGLKIEALKGSIR